MPLHAQIILDRDISIIIEGTVKDGYVELGIGN